jgi:uncharacterized protein involved in exopolysaccharide biosynthesis
MHSSNDSSLTARDLIAALRSHISWWVTPAVVGLVLAAVYSLASSREWRATQAMTIRPEAASVSEQKLGKFSDLSEMKVLQATVLELAKSQSVVQATLREVGATGWFPSKDFPTAQDVDTFRQKIDMRPPGGAEFGQTEVFYLSVRDADRDRAAKLLSVLADQLEKRMQSLRAERAQSEMKELEGTVNMAETDLNARTQKLAQFESSIGADLSELRNLNANIGGQGEVSQELQAIEADRRSNESRHHDDEQLLIVLKAAQEDPHQLVATPNSLLVSQPALSRLKDALVDAQVHTAQMLGIYADDHPYVVASRETEKRVQAQLHDELELAVKGLEVDLRLTSEHAESLSQHSQAGRDRIARLAAARSEYANLVAAVDNHTKLVEAARKNLADARADHASAHSASVLGRIDGVEAGVQPIGPGRLTITAGGGVAGSIFGFGLVFLFGMPQVAAVGKPAVESKPQSNVTPQNVGIGFDRDNFGMYRGMTLEQAVRSAEQRMHTKTR